MDQSVIPETSVVLPYSFHRSLHFACSNHAESGPELVDDHASVDPTTATPRNGLSAQWQNVPLYARIVIALVLGVIAGLMLDSEAAVLAVPGKLVLRLLGALAPALILAAIVHTFMTTHLGGAVSAEQRL